MKTEWNVAARQLGLAVCLGGSLFLFGCGENRTAPVPGGALPTSRPPVASSPGSKGGPPPVSGAPAASGAPVAVAPVPTGGTAPPPAAGPQKNHGTVKTHSPERTSIEVVTERGSSNYMVKSPDVLEKVNPGDEIDFTTENTDKGMIVVSVTVTKAGTGTPIPKAVEPGASAPTLPSGAPAPAGPSGAPKGAPAHAK